MRRSLSVVLLSAISIFTVRPAAGQPYHRRIPPSPVTAEHTRLLAEYERALFDSAVYQSDHLRPLRPLTADEHGEVLVATLTSLDGKVGELLPIAGAGVWVTGVPEVRDICREFTGDVVMQLRQLLGLPPDAHEPRMIVLRVKAADIFRPAVDPNVFTTSPCQQLHDAPVPADCGNVFPSATTPSHYAWIATQSFALHQLPHGYPWTHLGYTYNWTPNHDRYGASEYIIRPGAPALIRRNVTPEEYCRPDQR
jgi:hypothetical protein